MAMDYGALAPPTPHSGWESFLETVGENRIILMTTKGATSIWTYSFHPGDIILMGRESAGAPDEVHERADARLLIPLAPGARALNVATAAAIALAEARRQIGWPEETEV